DVYKRQCVEYGAIQSDTGCTPWECHVRIYEGIEQLVREYQLDAGAVESQFFFKNVRAALRIGEARSVAILPLTRAGVPVFEYAPSRVKQAVVGRGSARKEQVQFMIQRILNLREEVEPDDAADALALAICHAHAERLRERIG
ncbi:MAG: crossover junction endodeoxyribonuclease RuvC, partial [bacterium]|nr:crossover junction endodeoxyribonuclease RuvC [bacterium]